ncbi:MAG: ADP-dependent NAD(P)H-hydrate dehydratase / NAD(P)H-hydrate epimerase [Actinomycetota bacterium]|nr:ADP-dependent NAD(P)H-hydrate dehydratase / NAD(P)H-hydrate epimerase [Actinomycetota bacterium]
MQPVLTPAEMAEADRRAIAGGTAESVLVERAGVAVARHALRMLGGAYGRRVVVVCGKGNNGADGVVAARRLRARGVGVDEFALAAGIDQTALHRALRRADLAVDAMFGTGFRGALEGDGAAIARALAEASIPTLAVDIPSGIDGLTGEARGAAVRAQETVTFGALKPGLLFEPGRSCARRVHVVDIGIDVGSLSRGAPLGVLELSDLVLSRRTADGHKWSSAVFVIGGSPGMTGAPLLAGHAAARSGAGMVVCGVPGIDAANRASGSELVIRALPATSEGNLDADAAAAVLDGVDRFRGIAIGPGLGRDKATQEAVRRIVAECPIPIVVDADGLNALAHDPDVLHGRRASGFAPAILTPHGGEFERLAGAPVGPDRVAAARDLAARLESIVLLKGPGTVIADPEGRAVVNRTDGPALAAAGTGDVLTGVISGLLAGGASPFDAAATGAHVHGRAAVEAGTGDELIATDLIGALHPTLAVLRSGRDPREG